MENNKKRNLGYLCGIFMLLVTLAVTALIVFLSYGKISTEIASIFARDGFFNITKGILSFLGNIRSFLKSGIGMDALIYADLFCLAASILGFLQGALFKKRDLIS